MVPERRSDADLIAISEHLLYEISMLFGTAEALATSVEPDESNVGARIVHNALLDSFAIHARVLLDFLYDDDPRHGDDVTAGDFFDSADRWKKSRPAKPGLFDPVHRGVAKRVAHLTCFRSDIEPEERQWKVRQIAEEIANVLGRFFQLVPVSRICMKFREFISETVDAEAATWTLETFASFSDDGGVSLSLDPPTESLLTYYLKLSPSQRLRLVAEARRMAEEERTRGDEQTRNARRFTFMGGEFGETT